MGRVLVVEDNMDLLTLMRITLQNEGYEVVTAKNGEEALSILRSGTIPKLIFLDLMMPIMNGWEFLKHHAADPMLSEIPVVVCSAIQDQKPPAMEFLRKPVDLKSIVSTARKYIQPAL